MLLQPATLKAVTGAWTDKHYGVLCNLICVPGVNPYGKPLPKPRVPLTVGNGQCNLGMPNNVFDRFLWVINLYARAGFKIVIDNQ
jgi:hypothetical protein